MQTWVFNLENISAWHQLSLLIDVKQPQTIYLIGNDFSLFQKQNVPELFQPLQQFLISNSKTFCHQIPEYTSWQYQHQIFWHIRLIPDQFANELPPSQVAHYLEQTLSEPKQEQHKPWFSPAPATAICNAIVVGAGIAGASTAYALAKRGVQVTVLEKQPQLAQGASGNRQGLLYAKISAHSTAQTQLLLMGYGYTLRLLKNLLPEEENWQQCGILHLNFNATETKRNLSLSQQKHPWYYGVNAKVASDLAGIPIAYDGLFWPLGAWLNPKSLIKKLLSHPNINVLTNSPMLSCHQKNNQWQLQTPHEMLSASHLFLCQGNQSAHQPLLSGIHFNLIRGQTDLVEATETSQKLNIAISGKTYVSPAWNKQHCFGASFIFHDNNTGWRESEQQDNIRDLHALNPIFADQNAQYHAGHAAIRCDATDHLPVIGAIGHSEKLQTDYASLSLDKNYPIQTPCTWLPNLYVNTAHGTRGLATAPICAEALVAEACGENSLFPEEVRLSLHPNRFVIRDLIKQK